METHETPGLFSGNVKIYHYPSTNPSKKVVLALKGIYGEHVPDDLSWDNELVKLLEDDYHLVFVRTSRLNDKIDRDAFIGKTFEQECVEVESAFKYCDKNIFSPDFMWGGIGVSLGGTTLLGTPHVLSEMKTVIMVGSGCGKNPETTKPLLSSLPSTERLLRPLDNYRGTFIFLHGANDTIVPMESQQMIYDRSKYSLKHEWIELPNLDHSLRETNTRKPRMAEIAAQYTRENF
ncbi:MAG: alpha/beta hydrolase [Parcubacteria group bacterium]|nr:alpha/beta hydrolase [Parcubacteria group bacterium]